MGRVPPPIFTLRGHTGGVTALCSARSNETNYLISGDQDGVIIIWDLSIFRQHKSIHTFASRIQSIRAIQPKNDDDIYIVVQSRDNGLKIINLTYVITAAAPDSKKITIAEYSTYESLFSKGDAITLDNGQTLIAHPSALGRHLVTVRLLHQNGSTEISGSAQRDDERAKQNTIFDIKLSPTKLLGIYLLFVAYEDGGLCTFKLDLNSRITIPELNSTGLKIELIKKHDFGIKDFLSAFDVLQNEDMYQIVCGSPSDKLIFAFHHWVENSIKSESVKLHRPGTSCISIRPDRKLVAVGCWDSSVRLYSMKSRNLLASCEHHTKQVQDIVFILHSRKSLHEMGVASSGQLGKSESLDGDAHLLCCASLDGTISISDIY